MQEEIYFSIAKVRRRYGDCTGSCLRRWQKNPSIGFPLPIRIGARRYWPLSELQRWEAVCARRGSQNELRVQ
jgi:hypothetical protein